MNGSFSSAHSGDQGQLRAQEEVRAPRRLPWHQRAVPAALVVAIVGSILSLGLLWFMLAPGLSSALAAEVADGQTSFGVDVGSDLHSAAASVAVSPEAGWSVRPDPDGGVFITSPDTALVVQLQPVTEAHVRAALERAESADAFVATEVLATGLSFRHATHGDAFTGALETAGDPILVSAHVRGDAELHDYRTELANFLERITLE